MKNPDSWLILAAIAISVGIQGMLATSISMKLDKIISLLTLP